jgi:hypothetical protein
MVRRHLNMSRTEWRALPWDEQTELYEGLLNEFGKDKSQPGGAPEAEQIEQGEVVVGEDGEVDWDSVPYSGGEDEEAPLDDLAALGFAVRKV